jgi:hypothetical protein
MNLVRATDKPLDATGSKPLVRPKGRLIFALDATASRQPTWAIARELQARLFTDSAPVGQLKVQLAFYRGDECKFSKWHDSGETLVNLMYGIECVGGVTQIRKILSHAVTETLKEQVQGLVFVGDALEEPIAELASIAGELGSLHTPIHVFQEGRDAAVRDGFRLLALRSGGAYYELDPNRPGGIAKFASQLGAIARHVVGDKTALPRSAPAQALPKPGNPGRLLR